MHTKAMTLSDAQKVRDGWLQKKPTAILTRKERNAIVNKETLTAAAQKYSGRALDDLLMASAMGDIGAAKEILDRAFGKVPQSIDMTGEITIKALHAHVLTHALPSPTSSASPSAS